MASLTDILTSMQQGVQALKLLGDAMTALVPHNTSGNVSVNTLLATGFVRVTGVSVIAAGAVGTLHDAPTLAAASAANVIFTVPATVGYFPVGLICAKGLVYKPGAAQQAAIMFTET